MVYYQLLSFISFSSTLVQPSIECVTVVSYSKKSVGVGSSVLSICTEFLSDHSPRVMVDGAERLIVLQDSR